MTHRSGGRGTLLVDRVFPGLGRIRRATGTNNTRTADAINAMLSSLWMAGKLAPLRAIRDGTLHPLVAWETFKTQGPAGFPDVPITGLRDLEEWLKTLHVSQRHRQNLASAVRHIRRAARPGEFSTHLPEVLRRLRTTLPPRMFNVTRQCASTYARDTQGRRSELYRAIEDVPPLPYRPDTGNPFTPKELAALKLPQPYQAMAWSMALTGMRPSEYWGKWVLRDDHVEVLGTKRPASHRFVPRAGQIVEPAVSQATFRNVLRKAAPGRVPYDLRRSFGGWLEEISLPPTRIQQYLGHGPKTVTDRYLWREVKAHLRADGERLAQYIGEASQAVRAAAS